MEMFDNHILAKNGCVIISHYISHFSFHIYIISLFLKNTGLSLSTQLHAVACCCSVVILAQVLMYWSKSTINLEKERQVEKDKAE